MTQFISEILKENKKPAAYLIFSVLALFAALLLVLTVSYGVEIKNALKTGKFIGLSPESKNTISINGEGKVFAIPDVAEINLSVLNEEKTVIAAQEKNTKAMNKIAALLKDSGVAAKDIKTSAYNIYPRYDWIDNRQKLAGYRVEQTLAVKIRDLEKIGDILDGAAKAGANQIGQLAFTIDEPEKLKEQARESAIQNAREKASQLSRSLGVRLVRVVKFSETAQEPPIFWPMKTFEAGVGGGGEAPQIEPGEREIVSSVAIEWEIN